MSDRRRVAGRSTGRPSDRGDKCAQQSPRDEPSPPPWRQRVHGRHPSGSPVRVDGVLSTHPRSMPRDPARAVDRTTCIMRRRDMRRVRSRWRPSAIHPAGEAPRVAGVHTPPGVTEGRPSRAAAVAGLDKSCSRSSCRFHRLRPGLVSRAAIIDAARASRRASWASRHRRATASRPCWRVGQARIAASAGCPWTDSTTIPACCSPCWRRPTTGCSRATAGVVADMSGLGVSALGRAAPRWHRRSGGVRSRSC